MKNIKDNTEIIISITLVGANELAKFVEIKTSIASSFIIDLEKSVNLRVGDKVNVVINRGVK